MFLLWSGLLACGQVQTTLDDPSVDLGPVVDGSSALTDSATPPSTPPCSDGERIVQWFDADGDGFAGVDTQQLLCPNTQNWFTEALDCDDGDPLVNPGAAEICNSGRDDNCNDLADDDDPTLAGEGTPVWFEDLDGDGYGNPAGGFDACFAPPSHVDNAEDCDDNAPLVHPLAVEACNEGIDDDCDGLIDTDDPDVDVSGFVTVYPDVDRDQFGDTDAPIQACAGFAGHVLVEGDCDDNDPLTRPNAPEHCNLIDNDCNGIVDDNVAPSAEGVLMWFPDDDGDLFGRNTKVRFACTQPEGWVLERGDCDDTNDRIHPNATEICNDRIDDNCDGFADVTLDPTLDPSVTVELFFDNDEDGFGHEVFSINACPGFPRFVTNNDDCDDTRKSANPEADEFCSGGDDDCDGLVDEADPDVPRDTLIDVWPDVDEDGLGDINASPSLACFALGDMRANNMDCDDDDPLVGLPLRRYLDDDGDLFGDRNQPEFVCEETEGFVEDNTDCDDTNNFIHPDAPEICNDGVDDDCDGIADTSADPDLDSALLVSLFVDHDLDGFGHEFLTFDVCPNTPGFTLNNADCNDKHATVSPGATEICNGVDDDCDGLVDDEDPSLDLSTALDVYPDLDGDGWGDMFALPVQVCAPAKNQRQNNLDCDDSTADVGLAPLWYFDNDDDGQGNGTLISEVASCTPPSFPAAPDTSPIDCDDSNALVYSGASEVCDDGLDNNCIGGDASGCDGASCLDILEREPASLSGVYALVEVDAATDTESVVDAMCDMQTDGGGWTLVASTQTAPNDERTGYHADLTTLFPVGNNDAVWGGMRHQVGAFLDLEREHRPAHDVRFACKTNVASAAFAVDLSFYDVFWYNEVVSSSSDEDVCFNESDGSGADPAPARQNNLSGAIRVAGDNWDANGFLESEDSCGDVSDFTIDFDDRGMDSNETDGTDWGEDDANQKCGTVQNAVNGAWYIFVRE